MSSDSELDENDGSQRADHVRAGSSSDNELPRDARKLLEADVAGPVVAVNVGDAADDHQDEDDDVGRPEHKADAVERRLEPRFGRVADNVHLLDQEQVCRTAAGTRGQCSAAVLRSERDAQIKTLDEA
jgi:hypothetical protein